ncbi:MAG: CsgG/HfaB family protein [Lacunisphaera sp.]|nr:CsgG/HfaB family protein [Lacunisphaera sp.]
MANYDPMKITILKGCFCVALIATTTFASDSVRATGGNPAISPTLQPQNESLHSLKRKVAIARFTNETNYGKSFLVDKDANQIGKQAVDILSKKLLDTGKFVLLERADMDKINAELGLASSNQLKNAADYLIVGSITEFGRKTEGNVGVFTRKKKQTAYAKVTIRLVDVYTGQIIYAEDGSGEAFSEVKTAVGLGPTADYDSTLNDKALDVAITNLASRVIENLLGKPWRAYVLTFAEGNYLMTGGQKQGVKPGDMFDVFASGKKVKNPQSGTEIALPSKKIAQLKVTGFAGEGGDEVSLASLVSGELPKSEDAADYQNLYIQESK